ncbi:beta-galactosidase [Stenotrophomonas mori]|uniref:Cellulase family glycosylhydrolase n=1 Tax=Stenotrophomonas mori TaxID=2871096 RepID=A0ABT0SJR0_9GAMM|nr:beta-galactosidase [Stenotrophomonas mori]MCL7715574.1 cellulase family glycosylhydrolase [Stenotrophomonas mori]
MNLALTRPARRGWRRAALLLVALAALLGGVGACAKGERPAMELVPPRAVEWRDFLGVNAHFLWFEPARYRQQMDQLQALGLQWVRVDLHWDTIEPREGAFRWDVLDPLMAEIQRRGLKAEVYLVGSAPHATSAPAGSPHPDQYPPKDPALYATALVRLAQRYPQVEAWQVWNEPNLPAFWRPREDPAAYGRLLLTSVQALRAAAPGRRIVLGGMGYFSQMPTRGGGLMVEELAKGGLYSLDVITAYHPYSLYPEGDDPKAMDFILRAQQGNAALRAAGARDIWADEWGWSSYDGPREEQPIIGVQGQADYVTRRLALMSALDYDKVFLFALSDLDRRAGARDRRYGLLDERARPKPVHAAVQRLLHVTGPRITPGKAPALATVPPGLVSIAWQREDGRRLWFFWADTPGQVQLRGVERAQLHDVLDGSEQALQADAGRLAVPVGTTLSVLEW